MKQLLSLFSIAVLLFASAKNNINPATQQVHVRIINATGITLENAIVGDVSYGNVPTASGTGYKIITSPIYAGYCTYSINGVESGTGYGICGTPMPPAFETGYYTFTIETSASGYNVLTVKKQ